MTAAIIALLVLVIVIIRAAIRTDWGRVKQSAQGAASGFGVVVQGAVLALIAWGVLTSDVIGRY